MVMWAAASSNDRHLCAASYALQAPAAAAHSCTVIPCIAKTGRRLLGSSSGRVWLYVSGVMVMTAAVRMVVVAATGVLLMVVVVVLALHGLGQVRC
jgi:hypothetical protein